MRHILVGVKAVLGLAAENFRPRPVAQIWFPLHTAYFSSAGESRRLRRRVSPAATPFDITSPDSPIPPLCSSTVCGVFWVWLFLSIAPLAQRSDTMPIVNHTTVAAERLARALAHLRQAALLIEEVAPGIVQGLVHKFGAAPPPAAASDQSVMPTGNGLTRSSIIDETTFSVRWADRTCRLGNTVAFRLLARLARRPNQLVACETLLDELWDRHTSCDALRSTVKVLRRKLTAAGMEDLAAAIDGSTSHYYALMLAGR